MPLIQFNFIAGARTRRLYKNIFYFKSYSHGGFLYKRAPYILAVTDRLQMGDQLADIDFLHGVIGFGAGTSFAVLALELVSFVRGRVRNHQTGTAILCQILKGLRTFYLGHNYCDDPFVAIGQYAERPCRGGPQFGVSRAEKQELRAM